MTNANRLLIVEDDPSVKDLVALVGAKAGYQVTTAEPPERVVEFVRETQPTVIVLDLMMPKIDGVQVLRALSQANCDAVIVLFSAAEPRILDATTRIAEGLGLRVRDSIRKPVSIEVLQEILARHHEWVPSIGADDVRGAIERGEIEVNYQPKVSLGGNRSWEVRSCEALARWRHPQLGLIGAEHFVALAEEAGVIGALTEGVMTAALRRCGELARHGHAIGMSINLSPLLLGDLQIPSLLAREIERNGLDAGQITLEITEGAALPERSLTAEVLTRLTLTGARVAMDDYGAGYSSLMHLYRLPFAELKIDKSLIDETVWNGQARSFVGSVVALAHNLGVSVCAEGVESADTLDYLASIGCDQAQGFYISKPLSDTELSDFLARELYDRSARIAAAAMPVPA